MIDFSKETPDYTAWKHASPFSEVGPHGEDLYDGEDGYGPPDDFEDPNDLSTRLITKIHGDGRKEYG